jgi:hypothetical protein
MSNEFNQDKPIVPAGLHFDISGDQPGLAPWTEIEEGRFMPRRVRGSCQGRALG